MYVQGKLCSNLIVASVKTIHAWVKPGPLWTFVTATASICCYLLRPLSSYSRRKLHFKDLSGILIIVIVSQHSSREFFGNSLNIIKDVTIEHVLPAPLYEAIWNFQGKSGYICLGLQYCDDIV